MQHSEKEEQQRSQAPIAAAKHESEQSIAKLQLEFANQLKLKSEHCRLERFRQSKRNQF
jgi:hypothetical protein